MRYLMILSLFLLTVAFPGCDRGTSRSPRRPADDVPATGTVSPDETRDKKGLDLDIDVGGSGVDVETRGRKDKPGVDVDVEIGGDNDTPNRPETP